ncbi:MAG: hypothetical protein P4N60_00840 [Verrucomicrobiae bacterium]|nr:hypothetical protein [Verrucomicrobiae bacterium]
MKTAVKDKALPEPTWKPYRPATHGRLSTAEKASLPDTAFAFPRARKEPMTDAAHVRDAMARFNQVSGVTDAERDLALANFKKAASHFDIQMKETDRQPT